MKVKIKEQFNEECYREICQILFEMTVIRLRNMSLGLRVKKDGMYYKADRAKLIKEITYFYDRLFGNFEVDTMALTDERDTILRALNTLSAKECRKLMSIFIEPYKDIEYEED